QLAPIVEGEPRAIGLPRRFGAVGARCADRRQLDIGARLQGRQMRARRPGSPDAGADQAQPKLLRHAAPPVRALSPASIIARTRPGSVAAPTAVRSRSRAVRSSTATRSKARTGLREKAG